MLEKRQSQEKKTIFLYQKKRVGKRKKKVIEVLLRKINVQADFRPSVKWMNTIEPLATHWSF